MNLGNTIKTQRIRRGFDQKSFASLCSISQTYLSQIENERREPNLTTLKVIAKELSIPLPILFFLSLDEKDIPNDSKRKIFQDLGNPVKNLILESLPKEESHIVKRKKHLEAIIGCEFSQLKEITDNLDNYYRPYIKRKVKEDGSVKEREISPTIEPLKSIQSAIHKKILSRIALPNYVVGGVKGKDNVSNALFHKGNKFKLCTDLSAFFPSISHKHVYNMLTREGFSPDVASMITKLTTYKGKVPQGAPTSTDIANLVFLPYDREIHKYCTSNDITYTRFVDDLTFSSQNDFQDKAINILQFVFDSPYKISNKKTFYTKGKAVVTGVVTGQNKLSTTKEFKEKLSNTKSEKSRKGMQNYENRVAKVGKRKRKNLFS